MPARTKRPDHASSSPAAIAATSSTTRSGGVQSVKPRHIAIERVIGVSTTPGATSKARTPLPSQRPASASVSRISPVLATE